MPYDTVGLSIVRKLPDLFNKKRLQLRKRKWESKKWDEYDFQVEFQQDWDEYLKGLGCDLLDCDALGGMAVNAMADKWNSSCNKDTVCVQDPERVRSWIFVPRELAKKILVLGSLP